MVTIFWYDMNYWESHNFWPFYSNIRDHPFKTSAIFYTFLTSTPLEHGDVLNGWSLKPNHFKKQCFFVIIFFT